MDVLEAKAEHMGGPVATLQAGLGNTLLLCITWSSMAKSVELESVTHGVWAGDRFDVWVIDCIKNEEGWKDVSKDVANEIERIIAAFY